MNKKLFSLLIFVGFFCLAGFALAAGLTDPLGGRSAVEVLKNIARWIGYIVAPIGTVMVVIAGILFLTSAGSPERMGTAKKTLIYGIIGMVVGFAAADIVTFFADIAK
jgi:riboflavin transporter FmnP